MYAITAADNVKTDRAKTGASQVSGPETFFVPQLISREIPTM